MIYVEKIDSQDMPHEGDWYSAIDEMTLYRWDGRSVFEIDGFDYRPVDKDIETTIIKAIEEFKNNG